MALQYNDVVQAQQGMSREDIATQAQKLVPLTPLPKPTPQAPTFPAPETALPSVIDSSVLGTTTKASVPTAAPSSPPPALNVADQILQQTQVEDTAAQKQATNLSQSIIDLLPKLQGETAALADEQNKAGVSTLKSDLNALNAQILQKQAEIGQSDTQLVAQSRAEETRDTLLPFAQNAQAKLAGDAAILRALKTSEIGVLNARAIAKQGDIALAMETAKQAVDVKYAPYKEAINLYKAQLEALTPILSRDEKKQAQAMQLKTDLALRHLEEEKTKAKENLSLIFTSGLQNKFINKNGEFIRASDGKSYDNVQEFFKDAGVTSFEEAYSRGLVGDLNATLLADREFAMQAAAKYPDAGIKPDDTQEEIAAKLSRSRIYRRETYIAPVGGASDPLADAMKALQVEKLKRELGLSEEAATGAVDKATNLKTAIDDLLKDPGLSNAVGPLSSKIPVLTGKRADFEAKFRNLQALLTIDSLSLLKGPMSDKDIQFLKESSSALNLSMSEKGFKNELLKLSTKINEKLPQGLEQQVVAKGYNYQQMRKDGLTDEQIKKELGL